MATLVQDSGEEGPVSYHSPILSRRVRRALDYALVALSAVLFSYLILQTRW